MSASSEPRQVIHPAFETEFVHVQQDIKPDFQQETVSLGEEFYLKADNVLEDEVEEEEGPGEEALEDEMEAELEEEEEFLKPKTRIKKQKASRRWL
jgi:hypothetical protein